MGEYQGRKVAVKVLRVYLADDTGKIIGVGHLPKLMKACLKGLTSCIEVLQGSFNMEEPPPPECASIVGSDNG